ncbi:MAG: ACP S-malonyltransferase [Bacillota bacterium]|nr:ACP S-malonyltransferase [Bacillota bacterium]
MNKKVFVFPGQGSQYVGMGADLFRSDPAAAHVFKQADQILGYSLTQLCFEGPAELLNQTGFTQPAVFTTSIAVLEVLKNQGVSYEAVAGHSLGEYSALVAAGVLNFSDALKIVQKRAQLMEKTVSRNEGGMAAILGLERGMVEEICCLARAKGIVQPANFNAPEQVVISGEKAGLEEAFILARKAGAKRIIPLPVSGPFHCSLMEGAGQELALYLEEVSFSVPRVPYVANVLGDYVSDPEAIKSLLVEQVKKAVYWEESIKRLSQDGYNTFIEVGPGKVLSGLIKRIVHGAQALYVEDRTSLQKVLAQLRGTV